MNVIRSTAAAFAAALLLAAPLRAQANQCVWGCHCEGNGCGCNSYGSGASCDAGGNGCAVMKCDPKALTFRVAPDGSLVQLASVTAPRPGPSTPRVPPSRSRWEYASRGHSVARDCRGIVVARYFDRRLAAVLRRQQRSVTI